ncbi:Diaminopimelate epimerase [bioreactor metagenome]|uniref:Diaminopimelate epimerase n=1 Tax=bioreactor metagenome TaxID=1076179 RepID=A0A644T0W0_9ZZZZ|nr:diaminopimelate epimerase [Negativicutes bacterium]
MQFNFSKWHGLGNDFVIVNGFTEKIEDYQSTAIKVCNRHFGIGADGLVLVLPSENADFRMRIFNSDGSEAEMCGNVTRCVARYVYESGLTEKTKMTIETQAGLIRPELIFNNGVLQTVRVDMGEPRLNPEDIPVTSNSNQPIINTPLVVGNQKFNITCVSMGNPHCIIFVDDINAVNLSETGPLIEKNPIFPRKTNVEFVQILNRETLMMRVWERGAGVTLACGTGACATLVAAALNNRTDKAATLKLDGGDLHIEWGSDNHIYMSGPATEVFQGCYLNE